MSKLLTFLFSFLFCISFFISIHDVSEAAVFNVTNSMEFQDALDTASMNGEADTINLAAGTYLTGGSTFTFVADPTEDFGLTISGAGVAQTILDGENNDQILSIDMSGIDDEENTNVVISGITFQNGNAVGDEDGGGLELLRDNLIGGLLPITTVENCEFLNNSAGDDGGGMLLRGAGGDMNITDCTFSGNNTGGDGGGANVNNPFGDTFITNNVFDNNDAGEEGGGISSGSNDIFLTENIFDGNTSVEEGGGADLGTGGLNATVRRNVFMSNSSTAGDGGGANFSGGGAVVFAENNIVIDNDAAVNGGGFHIRGGGLMATAVNNTVSLNDAGGNGGGLAIITLQDGDTVGIANNIVINNSSAGNGDDIYVDDDEDGNDIGNQVTLIFNDFSSFFSVCQANDPPCVPDVTENDNIDEDPLFMDVNSGDVRLFEGSPAIDSGSNIDCAPIDQRGIARPQDGTGNMIAICDMGAIEMLLDELVSKGGDSGCTLAPRSADSSLPLYLIIPAIFILIGLRRRK